MNVKIKNKDLRFKISGKELGMLVDGHPVLAKVELLDKTLVTTINPVDRGERMEPELVLDGNEAYLNLCVPRVQVQALSKMGPSRDGMTQKTGDVLVTLQVDMPGACHA